MSYCTNCGTQINETDKFCSNCGEKIQQSNINGNTNSLDTSSTPQFNFDDPYVKIQFDIEKFNVFLSNYDYNTIDLWESVGSDKLPEYIWNIDVFFDKNKITHLIKKSFLLTEKDVEVLRTSQNFVQYENGDFYIGEFLDNKKHGLGTFVEFNSEEEIYCCSYFGNWENDKKEGFGVTVNTTYGDLIYYGNFHNNQYHGSGISFYSGIKSEGAWEDGMKNGHFIEHGSSGFILYEGFYVNSMKKGYGVSYYYDSEKKQYSGLWNNNLENGYGRYFDKDGSLKYFGFFENGYITFGKEYSKNDNIVFKNFPKDAIEVFLQLNYYSTEEVSNVRWHKELNDRVEPEDILFEAEIEKATFEFIASSSGILLYKNNDPSKLGELVAIIGNNNFNLEEYLNSLKELERDILYEGSFIDEEWSSGKGKVTYSGGDIYEGDFVEGHITGKGKFTWLNGNIYEGDWVDEQRTGKGKYTFANGDIYEGDWVNGQRTGKGKYTQADGGIYEGDFVDGEQHGKGKFTSADGGIYEGDFVNGHQHGKGKVTFADGNIYEGDFVDGLQNGYGRRIQDNGTYIGHFVNGLLDGNAIFVDNDGKEYLGRAEKGNFIPSDLNTNESSNNDSSPIKFKDGAGIR